MVFISALRFVISGAFDLLVVHGASFSLEPLLALDAYSCCLVYLYYHWPKRSLEFDQAL